MRKNTCVFIYNRCKVLKTCLFNPRNHSQFGPLVSFFVSLIVSFITQPRHKMPLHNAMFLPLVIVLSGPLLDHFSGEPNLSDRNLVTVLQLNGSKVYNLGIRRQTWVQFNKKHIQNWSMKVEKCASKVRKKTKFVIHARAHAHTYVWAWAKLGVPFLSLWTIEYHNNIK